MPRPRTGAHARARSRAGRLSLRVLLAVLVLAGGVVGTAQLIGPGSREVGASRPVAAAAPVARPTTPPQVRVLREWDRARAAAYARGSVGRLRELYVGAAGRSDVHLLRSYLGRGYRVEEMTTQLLAVEVLAHEPGSWLLRVTDRLAAAVAVRDDERVGLPRDRAGVHTVRLLRGDDGRWRVASVRG